MLILRYAAFALVATISHLATQRLILQFGRATVQFVGAVGAGASVGLEINCFLGKRWIFSDLETGVKNHSRKFSICIAIGLVTTAIFWSTETAIWLVWQTDMMGELVTILGLSVCYVVMYSLDSRHVTCRQLATSA